MMMIILLTGWGGTFLALTCIALTSDADIDAENWRQQVYYMGPLRALAWPYYFPKALWDYYHGKRYWLGMCLGDPRSTWDALRYRRRHE